MILITRGQANQVVVTLKEKVTLVTPDFLFEFKNDDSKDKSFFIASDISTFQDRFNEFTITEKTASPDPLAGEVALREGFYTYKVYEQNSTTNLDPDLAGDVVESGKVKVIDATDASLPTYSGETKTKPVYDETT